MKNKLSYLTECVDAINVLRNDVKEGQIAFFKIEQLPSGILPQSLADKCTSAVAGLSGNGSSSYVAVLPQRVDVDKSSGAKVYDSDPIIFAAKAEESGIYPTGVFVHHSDYHGRTQPILGFESYSYEQTVSSLKASLMTGQQPLSTANPIYLNAIAHGIAQFDKNLGRPFSDWSSISASHQGGESRDESLEGCEPES